MFRSFTRTRRPGNGGVRLGQLAGPIIAPSSITGLGVVGGDAARS
jgi:hypothetical protein